MVDEDVVATKLRHVNEYTNDLHWFDSFQQEVAEWYTHEYA